MNINITQPLHRNLQFGPDRVMTICGDRTRTTRQFVDRVARLAGAMQQLGMKPGDRVGMLSLNSDRYIEYFFAVPWGGGVVNPCNTAGARGSPLFAGRLRDDDSVRRMNNFRDAAADLRKRSSGCATSSTLAMGRRRRG